MQADEFAGRTCHAPRERVTRMAGVVRDATDAAGVRRVLDVGCGTGALVLDLAAHFPRATFTGVDVSAANIAAAVDACRGHPSADRVRFEVADYLSFAEPPFDLIVSDGVLHLIDAATDRLVAKLAADLAPGGLLVVAMATDCAYNRAFAAVRRTLRAVRSPALDGLILWIGRRLHGGEMGERMLRERVPYLYLPPARLMGGTLRRTFAARGLVHVATLPMPNRSLSQLVHAVDVFQRRR